MRKETIKRKKCVTALVLLMTLAWTALSHACGPEIPEKYLSFFSTQFIDYAPLKESLRVRQYVDIAEEHSRRWNDDWDEAPEKTHFNTPRERANLQEWQRELEHFGWYGWQLNREALGFLVYKLDRETLSQLTEPILYEHGKAFDIEIFLEKHGRDQRLRQVYELLTAKNVPNNNISEVFRYILFAKACEPMMSERSWNEREESAPLIMGYFIEEGKERYANSRSEWLKMRYAYQVVRLARYLGEYEKATVLYDEMVEPLQADSIIRYWALEHKTASLCNLGRSLEASPLVAHVFERAPELRETAYYCFDHDTPFATPHEKAVLWAIHTLGRGKRLSFEPLRQVYEFAPRSAFAENLLLRHLLDYEEVEFSPFLETPDELTLDTVYLKEFEDFVLEAVRLQVVRRPALWYLAAGYLRFMRAFHDKGYKEAEKLLQQAEDAAENARQIYHQARLLRHVVKIYGEDHLAKAFPETLYPELQWLVDRGETAIFQTVMTALGQKFLLQDELPYAVCCFYAANHNILWPEAHLKQKQSVANLVLDMYADDKGTEALHSFMTQNSYTAFESFLLRYLPLTQKAVLDVWGTKLLRQGRFRQALELFERIDPLYWERDNLCGESWHFGSFCVKQFRTSFFDNAHQESGRFVQTNKAEFTRRIVSLERQARRDRTHAAQYYRQIANAFYHTPYWGYAGVLWKGSLIWSFDYEYGADFRYYYAQRDPAKKDFVKFPFNRPELKQAFLKREKVFRQEYGTRAFALDYYQKALQAARDDELAAELLAISQKCVESPTMTSISSNGFAPENADYFRELHESYPKTAFHERLLEECPQFQAYTRDHLQRKRF